MFSFFSYCCIVFYYVYKPKCINQMFYWTSGLFLHPCYCTFKHCNEHMYSHIVSSSCLFHSLPEGPTTPIHTQHHCGNRYRNNPAPQLYYHSCQYLFNLTYRGRGNWTTAFSAKGLSMGICLGITPSKD